MKPKNHLALFAKYWQPGQVKTRLAAAVGNQAASQIYFEFLQHLLSQLDQTGDQRTVVFSPGTQQAAFTEICGRDWKTQPQAEGDLGTRLKAFFGTAFEIDDEAKSVSESRKVVVIGSDCPLLSPETINAAFALLDQHAAVLGPSHDGGYYLIGLNQRCDPIFDDIAWSTSDVLDQTTAVLQSKEINFALLPRMMDIDDADDLNQLYSELNVRVAAQDDSAMRLRQRLSVINPIQ